MSKRFGQFSLQLGNMRKAADFTIYPFQKTDKDIYLQSDRAMVRVNPETGEMTYYLSKSKKCVGFIYLCMPGAVKTVMDGATLALLKMQVFDSGTTISLAGGAITADNSGAVNLFAL